MMRAVFTLTYASGLWAVTTVTAPLYGVPGKLWPSLIGVAVTLAVFSMLSFGYRAVRDHAEVRS